MHGKIQFMSVSLTIDTKRSDDYETALAGFNYWEERIAEFNNEAPDGINHAFQSSYDLWCIAFLSQSLYQNGMQGFIFSLIFAFVILFGMTLNIIVTIFSVISIAGILVSILALIGMMGWPMGISESLAMIIFVGMSVDYVVHIAHNYVESLLQTRKER
jgi:hypothetical protein